MVAVALAGVLIYTVEKQITVPEFQLFKALYRVKGNDPLPGIHPDAPALRSLLVHREASIPYFLHFMRFLHTIK